MSTYTYLVDNKASANTSARTSVSSTASNSAKKSRWQRFVAELKPIETPETPIGIFSPLMYEKKPKSEINKQPKESYSRRASEAYTAFKTAVGGEPVHFRG